MTKLIAVPTIGRVVHYVMPDGIFPGEHRPAIIVKVWGDPRQYPFPAVQLAVFVDGTNDYQTIQSGPYGEFMATVWRTSVMYSEAAANGTWHWPEFEPLLDVDEK